MISTGSQVLLSCLVVPCLVHRAKVVALEEEIQMLHKLHAKQWPGARLRMAMDPMGIPWFPRARHKMIPNAFKHIQEPRDNNQ